VNLLSQISPWVQIAANIAIVIAIVFTALQIRVSSRAAEATLLKDLFDKNGELRKQFNKLRNDQPPYNELVRKFSDPLVLRYLEQLEPLFQIGHHYEYIGLLVRKKLIKLDIVFELIPVDKDIWVQSKPIRNYLRERWLPDWWENWEYLHNKYEELRNKRK
jgi:hypothetical protein